MVAPDKSQPAFRGSAERRGAFDGGYGAESNAAR